MAISTVNISDATFREWFDKTNELVQTVNNFGNAVNYNIGTVAGDIPVLEVGGVLNFTVIPKATWQDYRDRTNNRAITAKTATVFTLTQALIWS